MIKLIWMVVIPLVLSMEWYQEGNPTFLESNNYDTMLKDTPHAYKFIKFFTPYCRYCRFLKAVMDQIKSENHRDDIIFYEFNCNNHPNKCMQLGIYSYPHIIVYGPEGNQLTTLSGFYPKQIMKNFILSSMPVIQPKLQQPIKVQPSKQPQPPKQPQIHQEIHSQAPKLQPQQPKQPEKPKQQPKIVVKQQTPNINHPTQSSQPQDQDNILIKSPQDINEKQQKQIQNQLKNQVKQDTIKLQGQKQQPQNNIKTAAAIIGYYLHSIIKTEQPTPEPQKQEHFEGNIQINKDINKIQTNSQVLEEQFQISQVKDEDL